MITQDLLNAAKIRVRKTSSNVLDEDIKQLAEVAIRDLERIGVADIGIRRAVRGACRRQLEQRVERWPALLELQQRAFELERELSRAPFL